MKRLRELKEEREADMTIMKQAVKDINEELTEYYLNKEKKKLDE